MRYKIVHHGRKWPRAANHLDCRHCPECGATVNGNHGQKEHQNWHFELAGIMQSLLEKAGIEDDEGPAWTAVVEDDGQEAISG